MNWTGKESVDEILINGSDIDLVDIVKLPIEDQYNISIKLLWKACPEIYQCLLKADNVNAARDAIFVYLEKAERNRYSKSCWSNARPGDCTISIRNFYYDHAVDHCRFGNVAHHRSGVCCHVGT